MTDQYEFSNQTVEATIVFTGLTLEQVQGIIRTAAAVVSELGGQIDADTTLLCAQCERPIIPPERARPNDAGEPICGSCELTNFIEEQNDELEFQEEEAESVYDEP